MGADKTHRAKNYTGAAQEVYELYEAYTWSNTHETTSVQPLTSHLGECPRGVMVKAMNCGIVVREFVLQSRYYVHFRANTLGKGMNPLFLPSAMDK